MPQQILRIIDYPIGLPAFRLPAVEISPSGDSNLHPCGMPGLDVAPVITYINACVRLFAEGQGFWWVEPCFIAITRPGFEEAAELVARGRPNHLLVVPYFLFAGTLVARIEEQHPGRGLRPFPALSMKGRHEGKRSSPVAPRTMSSASIAPSRT